MPKKGKNTVAKRGYMTESEAKKLVHDLNVAITKTVQLTGELKEQTMYIEAQIERMIKALNS
jgi:polyhydroxyalkanoate synthesis regulator phasin